MKFKVSDKERTVTKDIRFYIKDKDDRRIPNDLKVTYKYLTVSGFKDLWDTIQPELADDGTPINDDPERIVDIMDTVITNIEGAADEDGNDLPYNRNILDAVFNDMSARPAVMDAFVLLHTDNGRKAAKAKN